MDDIGYIISQLTTIEKALLTAGVDTWHLSGCDRIALWPVKVSDGPNGARGETKNHLSLTPSLCLPCGMGLGASFDEDLVEIGAQILARQAKEKGAGFLLAPTLNLARHLGWGRCFESFSEDPFHAGNLGAAFIRGVQSENVIATAKHYVANESESERYSVSAEIDERTLREIYLLPFEYAVKKGGVQAIMTGYSRVNGDFVSNQTFLLQNILRDEWGFDGVVMTDWYANFSQKDSYEAGLDLEMPGPPRYFGMHLHDLLEAEVLDENLLDQKVCNLLNVLKRAELFSVKKALGMLKEERAASERNGNSPASDLSSPDISKLQGIENSALAGESPSDRPADRKIQYELAASAMVLLENHNLLPLDNAAVNDVAVIGPNSDKLSIMGGGSAGVIPHVTYSFSDMLQTKLPQAKVLSLVGEEYDTETKNTKEVSKEYIKAACELAKRAQYVILLLGTDHVTESEGYDKHGLALPLGQDELVDEVLRVNKNVIVVVNSGTPVLMPWAKRCPALLQAFFGGMEMAPALCDVLLGIAEPSGRLPVTIPLHLEQTPAFCNFPGVNSKIVYAEQIFIGYRWYEKRKIEVLYPFGYGLSYADFDIKEPEIIVSKDDKTLFEVKMEVVNTSLRKGTEVVQLYVSPVATENANHLHRAVKELKKFAKVTVLPGESKSLSFYFHKRDFAYYDSGDKEWEELVKSNSNLLYSHGSKDVFLHRTQPGWYVDGGEYEIATGRSSADICYRSKVFITGSPDPLDRNAELF